MDYFFSRLGRGLRYTATVVGSLSIGVIIILGSLGIQSVVIPICGGIALIPMAMVMFENFKVIKDMENLVIKFKSDVKDLREINNKLTNNVFVLGGEIDELEVTNNELKDTKDQLVDETIKLENLLKDAEGQVETLGTLAKDYDTNIKNLSVNLQKSENNNDELKANAEELVRIKLDYEKENNILKDNIDIIGVQIKTLSQAKNEYAIQLDTLKQNNEDINETSDLLKEELNNVNNAYDEAKDVIETLLRSKKVLNDIYDGMAKTEEKTGENVGMMSKLLNVFGVQRSKELFDILDKDGNKLLTNEEFINGILNNNNNNNNSDEINTDDN